MTARTDLAAHLASLDLPQGLVETLTTAAAACVEIRQVVAGGALVGALGGLLVHGNRRDPLPMSTASLAELEGDWPLAGLMTLRSLSHP